jgi:hypothetical protein
MLNLTNIALFSIVNSNIDILQFFLQCLCISWWQMFLRIGISLFWIITLHVRTGQLVFVFGSFILNNVMVSIEVVHYMKS